MPDTAERRKARGAFFTPEPITRFIAEWAIRSAHDAVLEPSAGDAAFLVEAVARLQHLAKDPSVAPRVDGVEIHAASAQIARERVREAGGDPHVVVSDFFRVDPQPQYSAVIGNPPFIRYQGFTGTSRAASRAAALRAGVSLTALASSWAAFTVHSALFLRPGGRLGLVLPAELLSVNYASAVRRFLFDRFSTVRLVLFDEQVFPEAEADVVLLLAEGFGEGPTNHAIIHQARNADSLQDLEGSHTWTPTDPADKWTALLVDEDMQDGLRALERDGQFEPLEQWGDTTLGMVTGNNAYFALSPAKVHELGLSRKELIRLSPPGSSHLRGLSLSPQLLTALGNRGQSTWLFRPSGEPTPQAAAYIEAGHIAGVDGAYKCRVRKPWWRVPLVPPADLLLTCMNADTPRLTTNSAKAHHLNSVHGVYLGEERRELGTELLPLASLNSVTVLHAEMVGRSYGGGVLKIEPREADRWVVPSLDLLTAKTEQLKAVKRDVAQQLGRGQLERAVHLVDAVLFGDSQDPDLHLVRREHRKLATRRLVRSQGGR